MAKKSQTRARRNNTQVGPQVVNFYNHGTVNVDARQNNSTSPKNTYTYCTVYHHTPQDCRPFTLRDQIEEGHPILGKINPNISEPVLPGVSTPVASADTNCTKSHKSSLWGWLAVGVGISLAAATATAKYFNN